MDSSTGLLDPVSNEEVATAMDYLRSVTASSTLQSLHTALSYRDDDAHRLFGPISFMEKPYVLSFSVHEDINYPGVTGLKEVPTEHLCRMLSGCPKLRVLAYKLPDSEVLQESLDIKMHDGFIVRVLTSTHHHCSVNRMLQPPSTSTQSRAPA
jgi:hypothetical protein